MSYSTYLGYSSPAPDGCILTPGLPNPLLRVPEVHHGMGRYLNCWHQGISGWVGCGPGLWMAGAKHTRVSAVGLHDPPADFLRLSVIDENIPAGPVDLFRQQLMTGDFDRYLAIVHPLDGLQQ